MKIFLYSWRFFLQRRSHTLLLALFSFFGSFSGVMSARNASDIFLSLMGGSSASSVSIVCRTFLLLLPYFAVMLAALYSYSFFLFPLCAIKTFFLGYCAMGIWLTYGSAGWIICSLLLGAEALSTFVFVRLCFCHIEGFHKSISKDILRGVFFAVVLGVLDVLWIVPLCANIIYG